MTFVGDFLFRQYFFSKLGDCFARKRQIFRNLILRCAFCPTQGDQLFRKALFIYNIYLSKLKKSSSGACDFIIH